MWVCNAIMFFGGCWLGSGLMKLTYTGSVDEPKVLQGFILLCGALLTKHFLLGG